MSSLIVADFFIILYWARKATAAMMPFHCWVVSIIWFVKAM